MISSYADITYYLRRLGDLHPDIKEVVVGDSEQIMSQDRSKLDYPCLWIETPKVTYTLGSHNKSSYSWNITVLINTPVDDWVGQQHILHRCLNIVDDLLAKINQDAEDGHLYTVGSQASADAILGYGHDYDFGWRFSLQLGRLMPSCPGACSFAADASAHLLPEFSYTNNNLGDFTDIFITDLSTLEDVTATEWKLQKDGGTISTLSTPPNDIGQGEYLMITLKKVAGGVTYYASLFVTNTQTCASSVPYIIDKKYC